MWPFRGRETVVGPAIQPACGDAAGAALVARLASRDWRAAHDFLITIDDPDDFSFYIGLSGQVRGLQASIDEWIQAAPHSTLPVLVRGAHAIDWAWEARGSARAANTADAQFHLFFQRLKLAEDCLDEVVDRHPDDPTAWALLVLTAIGRQLGVDEARRRFDEAVARCRWHGAAHALFLMQTCRKWSGSHEMMHAFADETAALAPKGSSLAGLVATAHLERWLDLPAGEDLAYLRRAEVRASLHAAADHSVRHPDYRRRPGWPGLHNRFAMAFWLAEEFEAAAEQFDAIGDLVTADPWDYLSGADPAGRFVVARTACYASRQRST